jgi:hypothetical protein
LDGFEELRLAVASFWRIAEITFDEAMMLPLVRSAIAELVAGRIA